MSRMQLSADRHSSGLSDGWRWVRRAECGVDRAGTVTTVAHAAKVGTPIVLLSDSGGAAAMLHQCINELEVMDKNLQSRCSPEDIKTM